MKTKLFPTICIFLAVVGLGFLVLKNYKANSVLAEFDDTWKCSFAVPVAQPIRTSSELLNEVYQEYNRAALTLQAAISSAQTAVASLSMYNDVCNFNQCTPEPQNISPDFVLGIKPLLFLDFLKFDGLGLKAPLCAKNDCVGDPCSLAALNSTLEDTQLARQTMEISYKNIKGIFETETEIISYDTATTSEEVGLTTTKQEMVERDIFWAQNELNSCGLTQAEEELVKQGKLANRKIIRCRQALEEGIYTKPKPWSEKCDKQCQTGPTEECINCLRVCEGTSFLARLNCHMYNLSTDSRCASVGPCCGEVCSAGFSPQCEQCLCQGLTQQQCLELVCGGAAENFLCCHQGEVDR